MSANRMGRAYTAPAAADKAVCERADCDHPVKAHGLCERHYQRERHRHRSPTVARILRRRARQRAMSALVGRHKPEFKQLLEECTVLVREEHEQLRQDLGVEDELVFLRPGPRADDEDQVDRVDLGTENRARCGFCWGFHHNMHTCPNCASWQDEEFDEVAVEQTMLGERAPLNDADKREVARRLLAQGGSAAKLSRLLRVNATTAEQLLHDARVDAEEVVA